MENLEEKREKHRLYMREWRANNPEKAKRQNRRAYLRWKERQNKED